MTTSGDCITIDYWLQADRTIHVISTSILWNLVIKLYIKFITKLTAFCHFSHIVAPLSMFFSPIGLLTGIAAVKSSETTAATLRRSPLIAIRAITDYVVTWNKDCLWCWGHDRVVVIEKQQKSSMLMFIFRRRFVPRYLLVPRLKTFVSLSRDAVWLGVCCL